MEQSQGRSGYKKKYRGYKSNYTANPGQYKQRSKASYPQNSPQENKQEMLDPYTAQMLLYRAEMYILLRYPYLIDLNLKNEGIVKQVNDNCTYFIIKSFSEEDMHKAIKYNVWTSTKSGNQTLNNAFKVTEERGGDVFLFYSCNGSGRFIGVAKMKSEVNYSKLFPYWTQDKWGGLFDIEWIFIKDVPFKEFKNIIITLKDGERKPVSNSRDTQEIPQQEGKAMLELIQKHENTNTLLEHFEYYDIRQDNYEKSNPQIWEKIQTSQANVIQSSPDK